VIRHRPLELHRVKETGSAGRELPVNDSPRLASPGVFYLSCSHQTHIAGLWLPRPLPPLRQVIF
jgi:hypothetical protein